MNGNVSHEQKREAITAAGMQVVSVFQRGTNDAAGGTINGSDKKADKS
ncbi:hypothetical protein [Brevibacillus porteri]